MHLLDAGTGSCCSAAAPGDCKSHLLHVTTSHSVLATSIIHQLLVLIILMLIHIEMQKCAKRPDNIRGLPSRTFATAATRPRRDWRHLT